MNKAKSSSARRKKAKTDDASRLEKELLQVFNLLTAIAKLLELEDKVDKLEAEATKTSVKLPRGRVALAQEVKETKETKETKGAKTPKKEEKHLSRAIAQAETWQQRDRVYRRVAAFCFSLAQDFLKKSDWKNAQKWMALSHRYSKLSMDPKKQITEEKLQELEDMVHEIQEHEKEEKDATNL